MAHYEIVPDRSTLWIDATSSVHAIHSRVCGLTGFLDLEVDGSGALDLSAAPGGRLELPVALLSSGNPIYDREMKRRADARKYPTITGVLSGLERIPGGGHTYTVRGDITFRGVTNTYEDTMAIVAEEDLLVLEGHHTFDIRDFAMEPPRIAMLKVHPDVAVRVEITARRLGPTSPTGG